MVSSTKLTLTEICKFLNGHVKQRGWSGEVYEFWIEADNVQADLKHACDTTKVDGEYWSIDKRNNREYLLKMGDGSLIGISVANKIDYINPFSYFEATKDISLKGIGEGMSSKAADWGGEVKSCDINGKKCNIASLAWNRGK